MSLKHFFPGGGEKKAEAVPPLAEHEAQVLIRLAAKVVEWKMTVPAILFLESVKPLNFIGAQVLVFFEPFVQTLFDFKDYDTFRMLMERRENVERLLLKIEELDALVLQQEKQAGIERRQGRKGWWSRLRRRPPSASSTAPD